MISGVFKGSTHLFRGISLISQPQLRRFVAIPLTINILLFLLGSYFLIQQMDPFVEYLMSYLPDFLQFLSGLLWLITSLIVIVFVFFAMSIVGGIIAAPFNALLAEAVERYLTGVTQEDLSSTTSLIKQTPHLILEEVRKLLYFVIRALPLMILFVIPVINISAPFIWFIFTSWVLALNYLSYPMENRNISFSNQRKLASNHRSLSLGFGLTAMAFTMIPFINFIIIPAAVAGATSLWVKDFSDEI